MSTSALTRRMPTKRDGFSWARIPQDSGGVLYRLYRRDMRGVLHVELLPFHSDWECCRCVVARRLREARHRLRDTVDDIDLEIMGLTPEISGPRSGSAWIEQLAATARAARILDLDDERRASQQAH